MMMSYLLAQGFCKINFLAGYQLTVSWVQMYSGNKTGPLHFSLASWHTLPLSVENGEQILKKELFFLA